MYLHVFALSSILLVFTCYFIFQHSKTILHPFIPVCVLLCLGLLIRMILAIKVFGYGFDIIFFSDWSARMIQYGPSGFYTEDMLTDYPPLYMYVLYVIGRIRAHFHIAQFSAMDLLMLKSPAICCDILCSFLIYWESRKAAKLSELQSICMMSVYLFHPVVILDSACWGQVDSILALFIVVLCICLKNHWLVPAYAIYGIGVLSKPQMLVFTPVLLVGIWDHVFLKDFSWKKFFCHLGSGICVIAGMVMFSIPFGLTKVIAQYTSTLGSYSFATVNGFNFWALIGMNGVEQDSNFLFLPARIWGSIAILLIVLFTFVIAKHCQDAPYKYYLLSAFIILTMFTFSVRMHERYIFPGIVLLVFLLIYKPIIPIWICYGGFSFLTFYNIGWVLRNYGDFVYHNDKPLIRLVAAGIVGCLIYFYYVIGKYCLVHSLPKKS